MSEQKARRWQLPLDTLIANSDFKRPGGVQVIEISAYDKLFEDNAKLQRQIEELKATLILKSFSISTGRRI
jgi:hypothetical protein